MKQKFTRFVERGKDREKVQEAALECLNKFAETHEIHHFQISEAQVIDGPGMAMPGMQGLAVSPSFELTSYVCYSDSTHQCSCGEDGCKCENSNTKDDLK